MSPKAVMWNIQIQLLDHSMDSQWWKDLIHLFSAKGHTLGIRCWNEEQSEIAMAAALSNSIPQIEGFETFVAGKASPEVIDKLAALPEPQDKQNCNRMTPFFTVNIPPHFYSEHYGTEVFLFSLTFEETKQVKRIMAPFCQSFRVDVDEIE